MAFEKKTWKNRIAEYINRRTLTLVETPASMESGGTLLVDVARQEGTISEEGNAFNEDEMNDLEERIAAEFTSQNETLATLNTNLGNKLNGTDYGLGTFTSSTATTSELSESIDNYKLINVVLVASASGNICASTIVTTRLFKTTSSGKTVRASINSGSNTFTGSAYYIDDTHIAGTANSTDFNTVVYGIK